MTTETAPNVPMITIDDKEYAIDALPDAAKVNLARAQQLQREIGELQMLLEERQLTLQARQNAVVKAVQEAEFEAANEAANEAAKTANSAESGSVQEGDSDANAA